MSAEAIARALGGVRNGAGFLVHCPVPSHGKGRGDRNPSLSIRDTDDGRLLVYCHGCQDQPAVISALRDRGLWPAGQQELQLSTSAPAPERSNSQAARRQGMALAIWEAAQPAPGTLVERYLRARGIVMPPPASLRYSSALRHGYTGLNFPGLIAAVTDDSGDIVAVHRTFLSADGTGKANVTQSKMCLGPLGDGAVALASAGPVLGLAEGVETALSAAQLFEIPVWAALGSRMNRVSLPEQVLEVQVFADNGEAGRKAADKAAEEFTQQGRRVALRFPPPEFGDWNDVIRAQETAA